MLLSIAFNRKYWVFVIVLMLIMYIFVFQKSTKCPVNPKNLKFA